MGLGLRLSLTCQVCEQPIDPDRYEDYAEIVVFGAVPYSVCPGCHQIVRHFDTNAEYRRRARVHVYEKTGRVLPVDENDIANAADNGRKISPWRRGKG